MAIYRHTLSPHAIFPQSSHPVISSRTNSWKYPAVTSGARPSRQIANLCLTQIHSFARNWHKNRVALAQDGVSCFSRLALFTDFTTLCAIQNADGEGNELLCQPKQALRNEDLWLYVRQKPSSLHPHCTVLMLIFYRSLMKTHETLKGCLCFHFLCPSVGSFSQKIPMSTVKGVTSCGVSFFLCNQVYLFKGHISFALKK